MQDSDPQVHSKSEFSGQGENTRRACGGRGGRAAETLVQELHLSWQQSGQVCPHIAVLASREHMQHLNQLCNELICPGRNGEKLNLIYLQILTEGMSLREKDDYSD